MNNLFNKINGGLKNIRGVGNTKLIKDISGREYYILVLNEDHKEQVGPKAITAEEFLSKTRGNRKPVVVDNSVVEFLISGAQSELMKKKLELNKAESLIEVMDTAIKNYKHFK